ncbi:hypothetical protein [Streptomyces yaizuensis]|uniref:FxLYD domain-containing protein n=1 Tax=Streptomyces yaizuensis TaxID=2989713 RepID=A0ABQ5NU52_9ACTN|nr:hypothetical protein [Streptomyces sp. YSPA8]GLF93899.1 FxLYD domain-containing protein [Streptomyces sp. YSPA8]
MYDSSPQPSPGQRPPQAPWGQQDDWARGQQNDWSNGQQGDWSTGQQPAFPPPPPPPPPKKSRAGLVITLSVLAGLAIAGGLVFYVIGSGDSDPTTVTETTSEPGRPAKKDATVKSCSVDESSKLPTAVVNITNNSSSTSNYVIDVVFVDAEGNSVTKGVANVDGVAQGQSTDKSLRGQEEVEGKVSCEIAYVTRWAQ